MLDLTGVPLYNQDEEERQFPQAVQRLKQEVREADALLIATPEYNYSLPAVLKNVLDWGSRPCGDNAWEGKRVGIMGASMGLQGTSRAQYHLRQVCVALNMYPLNRPEVMVPLAHTQFDAQGRPISPALQVQVAELVQALVASPCIR